MRILVLGDTHCDTHCDTKFINEFVNPLAVKSECDVIIQVGDFGFWPAMMMGDHKHSYRGFAPFIEACDNLPVPIYFLAGNHENHDALDLAESRSLLVDEVFISSNVIYRPTGATWEWDGVRCLAVGGAHSIDKEYRTTGIDWFPQELITDEQETKASSVGKVDVIFSHDAPANVDLYPHFPDQARGFWVEPQTEINRRKLQNIIDATEPSRVYHGHWHLDYTDKINNDSIDVYGLDCNMRHKQSFTMLYTEDFKNDSEKERS